MTWRTLAWSLGIAAVLGIAWAIFWPSPVPAQERGHVDTAIVFVVDRSSSISSPEAKIIEEGHAEAIQSAEVVEALQEGRQQRIAAAYVEFSSLARIRVSWRIIDGPASANAFGQEILAGQIIEPSFASGTRIDAGLALAYSLLISLPYKADKLVVDVTGDGNSQDANGELPAARQSILDLGATINGLPIVVSPYSPDVVLFFERNVVGGPAHFNLPLHDITEFPMRIRQKLVLELF